MSLEFLSPFTEFLLYFKEGTNHFGVFNISKRENYYDIFGEHHVQILQTSFFFLSVSLSTMGHFLYLYFLLKY